MIKKIGLFLFFSFLSCSTFAQKGKITLGLEWYAAPSQYGPGGWSNFVLDNTKLYKKNGKPKKAYTKNAERVMGYFNELVLSMDTYIKKPIGETESVDDDW